MHDICPCRAQAALGWLVLDTNQLEACHRHPGSIAMAGDFNNHCFHPPPPSSIRTLHHLPKTLNVRAKRTLDTPMSRAATAEHLKTTLQSLCNQLQAKKAAAFEGHSSLPLLLTKYLMSCTCMCHVVAVQAHLDTQD